MKSVPNLLAAAAVLWLATGCTNEQQAQSNQATDASKPGPAMAADSNDPIASAESAAPASVAKTAAIMSVDAAGVMKPLRAGSNGWTCMPDSPATPGPDPMCFDGSAGKWVEAWIGHKTPPAGKIGLMYMLEGGTDASNVDPYATKPTEGNEWVKTGPHLMVVGSKDILAGHPSGQKPDTAVPYVMWAGTPYAHLMIPVGAPQ